MDYKKAEQGNVRKTEEKKAEGSQLVIEDNTIYEIDLECRSCREGKRESCHRNRPYR